mmetsp:Transcript_42250/g.69633  ORF Transcript_42250/g.69633 Transcript_42250/m.69633 type:complete len:214 (+) Transcript_42250:1215-1856(+)
MQKLRQNQLNLANHFNLWMHRRVEYYVDFYITITADIIRVQKTVLDSRQFHRLLRTVHMSLDRIEALDQLLERIKRHRTSDQIQQFCRFRILLTRVVIFKFAQTPLNFLHWRSFERAIATHHRLHIVLKLAINNFGRHCQTVDGCMRIDKSLQRHLLVVVFDVGHVHNAFVLQHPDFLIILARDNGLLFDRHQLIPLVVLSEVPIHRVHGLND